MKIAFRVDASSSIGSGHLMRCLTLAHVLRARGGHVTFISRNLDGNFNSLLSEELFDVYELSEIPLAADSETAHLDWLSENWQSELTELSEFLAQFKPDLLVVDHYAFDAKWEREVSHYTKKLFVIDDLADREHYCDYLLDQTLYRQETDYKKWLAKPAELMLGTSYAILREEFRQWRKLSLEKHKMPKLENILITFGGVDFHNYTGRVLNTIDGYVRETSSKVSITVVMGKSAPHIANIRGKLDKLSCETKLVCNVSNMAEIMANNDLCIGAAGGTTWERCCLGLPSIVMVIADNQKLIAKQLKQKNIALHIDEPIESKLLEQLMLMDNALMTELSENAQACVDGLGTERIVDKLMSDQATY